MKKLLIAAAMVCAAAFVQAATVNWGISNVKDSSGGSPTAGWAVMAFYTEVGAGSAAIESAIAAGTAGTLAFDTGSLTVSLSKGKVSAKDATVAGITDTTKNYDFYFAVFNNSDATKATEYVLVGDLNRAYSGMSSKYVTSGNFSGLAWADIGGGGDTPEPTSGVLMLLGMAGLALRRKHA